MGGIRGAGGWHRTRLVSGAGSGRRLGYCALIALLLTVAVAAPCRARAADADGDEDLLEFLGGVGGEDADFADYLRKADIDKVAKDKPKADPPPAGKKS